MAERYLLEIDGQGEVSSVSYNGKPLKEKKGAVQLKTTATRTGAGCVVIIKGSSRAKICIPDGHGGWRCW